MKVIRWFRQACGVVVSILLLIGAGAGELQAVLNAGEGANGRGDTLPGRSRQMGGGGRRHHVFNVVPAPKRDGRDFNQRFTVE